MNFDIANLAILQSELAYGTSLALVDEVASTILFQFHVWNLMNA